MSLTREERFTAVAADVAGPVLRYALRRTDPHTAEDVVSETLLVVWRRLDDVPAGGELPWCYSVARNHLANAARTAKRRSNLVARIVRLEPPSEVELPSDPPDPELHRALARLRAEEQELLRLSAWEDLSPSEIAAVLGVSPNAISIRLHRARQRLAAVLSEEQGKDGAVSGHNSDRRGGSDDRAH